MVNQNKRSFVLYGDMEQHISLLTDDQAGQLLKGLFSYSNTGETPTFQDGIVTMAFSFVRAQLDRDAAKYEETCRRRSEAGKQGGRPKTNAFSEKQTKAKKANGFSEKQNEAKKTDTDTENENDTLLGAEPPQQKRFIPPTIEEVAAYCQKRGNGVDANRFVSHYAAIGWMIGKNKMRDWQAAVRTWERNNRQTPQQVTPKQGRADRDL